MKNLYGKVWSLKIGKKILLLTGSPRRGGNSDLIAKASGHEVKILNAGISKI